MRWRASAGDLLSMVHVADCRIVESDSVSVCPVSGHGCVQPAFFTWASVKILHRLGVFCSLFEKQKWDKRRTKRSLCSSIG